jgi:hypothetical protein
VCSGKIGTHYGDHSTSPSCSWAAFSSTSDRSWGTVHSGLVYGLSFKVARLEPTARIALRVNRVHEGKTRASRGESAATECAERKPAPGGRSDPTKRRRFTSPDTTPEMKAASSLQIEHSVGHIVPVEKRPLAMERNLPAVLFESRRRRTRWCPVGVWIHHRLMQLGWMLSVGPSSWPGIEVVTAFAAAVPVSPGRGRQPAVDAMLISRPAVGARKAGTAYRGPGML